MKTKNLLLLLILLVSFNSCEEDEVDEPNLNSENPNSDAIINFSFTNDGTNPSLTVDSTIGPVQIENNSTLTDSADRFIFTFTGVTFFENNDIFAVANSIAQSKTESGNWIIDNENQFFPDDSKSLDIVLVLDVSNSLANNIDSIKNSAVNMISQILFENPDARIAVVKFSEGNVFVDFSSDLNILANFIQSLSQYTSPITNLSYPLESRNATGLYEAILQGVSLLEISTAKGKGIITFTDGTNNYQEDPDNDNKDVVISALNGSNIKHYTVGFIDSQGEVDDVILTDIALNGEYASANSISNLNEVFTRFSNNIATIYDFIYQTNKSSFSGEKKFRLLIDLEKVN